MAVERTRARRAEQGPPTLELVLKRNSVERIKREKSPLGMLDELPALIAAGYEQTPEEDLVRLKWWGLYHDKPKIGTFMLRIKLPAGRVTAEQLRAVGELSLEHGKGSGELSTRQTIQLHYLELASLPEVFRRLDEVGLTTVGACGDAVRNVTGCPVAGVAADELFDVTPVARGGDAVLLRQPGLLRPAAQAQDHDLRLRAPLQRARDQLHLARRRRSGTASPASPSSSAAACRPCRGSHASSASSSRSTRRCRSCARSSTRGRKTCATALSRVKARLKFMVDDLGAEGMRAEVERRLGHTLADYELEPAPPLTDHMAAAAEKQRRARLARRPGPRRAAHGRPDGRRRRPRRARRAATSA